MRHLAVILEKEWLELRRQRKLLFGIAVLPLLLTALPIGGEFDFKIVKMNEAQKRIGLSFRALAEDEERVRLGEYRRQAAAASSSVGSVIKGNKSGEKTT